MSKKVILGIELALLLANMSILAFMIQPAKAMGTIYIRADGSVDPDTAPISSADNITYVFTDNINESIVVEKDNIVVDGSGFILEGMEVLGSSGINMSYRNNVKVINLKIRLFYNGIFLWFSSNVTINENTVTNNSGHGIYGYYSSNNRILGNIITNNRVGILFDYHSDHNIIDGNNIADNEWVVELSQSSNNTIVGNNLMNNDFYGIDLVLSLDNVILGNSITNNYYGILLYNSSNNFIHHNNFKNNSLQVFISTPGYTNIWDNDIDGNYWSNYTGVDLNNDGIGDVSHVLDAENQDRFPLMGSFNGFDAGIWNEVAYFVDVISNSTVSDFYFDPDVGAFLQFNVTGESEETGFCRVVIPRDLLWVENGWTVLVDSAPVAPTATEDTHYTYLYFTYNHSVKTVKIQGTNVIPESPSLIFLPLFILATLITVLVRRKKYPKT
ncbi:MAG: nitrous oxide reductase family maturation protein NosD [Promethearchaeota archaeon]